MNTRPLTAIGESTSHYVGEGYQYFYSKDKERGNTAKLQASKSLIEEFTKAKTPINSTKMPHLELLDQGGGWWLVCSDRLEHDYVVTEFLRKLNKWMLTKDTPRSEHAPMPARYAVEAKAHKHPGLRPILTARPPTKPKVSRSALIKLADSINEKFGHKR